MSVNTPLLELYPQLNTHPMTQQQYDCCVHVCGLFYLSMTYVIVSVRFAAYRVERAEWFAQRIGHGVTGIQVRQL